MHDEGTMLLQEAEGGLGHWGGWLHTAATQPIRRV